MSLCSYLHQRATPPQSLTLRELITTSLYHPQWGYYMTQPILGKNHDYITAPHLTDLFGYAAAGWIAKKVPHVTEKSPMEQQQSWQIIELGPGQGEWIRDICYGLYKLAPSIVAMAEIILVECNMLLRQQQKQHFIDLAHRGITPKSVTWYSNFMDILPNSSSQVILLANEFFDCLPIQQWINGHERCVRVDQGGGLFLDPCSPTTKIYETCEEALIIVRHLKSLYPRGQGIFIDYGNNISPAYRFSDTLQALRHHKQVDMMSNLGQCDITHQVDFHALMQLFPISSLQTQRDFLYEQNLDELFGVIATSQDSCSKNLTNLGLSLYRLLSVGQMGQAFKVLTFSW